jgi:hypothetical protein
LKQLPPEEVARAAAKDQEIRSLVMDNPSLVDASDEQEAQQKIEIMGGSSPQKVMDAGPHADIDSIGNSYGKSWICVLGYNEMGDGLADAVNGASGSTDGDGGEGNSSDGGSTTSSLDGHSATGRGASTSPGTGSTSIGTNTGSAGNSGGAGNGIGSGAGNGFGGES